MDPRFPYPSQRMPILARNVVATSQPLAASAGLRMLWAGGNAIDAAVATAVALTVVEPTGNGIGGDAFAILWDGERLHGLNASGRSPRAWTPERFADREAMPSRGEEAVTVPGAPSAWAALHDRFGALPFERLFEPAIRYAEDGFPVSPRVAGAWQRAERAHGHRQDFAAAFLPAGRAPRAGEIWSLPEQAETLRRVARDRGEAFYRGPLAQRIAKHVRAGGGALTEDDLAAHAADWVGTMAAPFAGAELHEIPPNGQGLAALLALGILRHTDLADAAPDGLHATHLQIEAMKLAFADARRYVADADHLDLAPERLLDDAYLAERAALVDPARAGDPGWGEPPRGGTVYLCAADAEGCMVSLIQSNYEGFGSGVVVPGTGIALHNRASGFTLEAGHPNRVGPGKRPFHTIVPAFLTRRGAPGMAFGVMGAEMQPQGHLQMLVRTELWGQNPQAASDAPRWRLLRGREVALETGMPREIAEGLRRRGHRIAPEGSTSFGGAQLVRRLADGGYVAASDHRKDGQAVGF